MIVKGQSRAADSNWVKHLQRADHNEEVRVVEARHLAHTDIAGAIAEMDAYAIGTRCQKPLFDVVLRPTAERPATTAELLLAASRIEEQYPALRDRPRLIVEHVKDGYAHWHVSWARCDGVGAAVNLPWTKTKLMAVSLSMYREMGVEPPAGALAFEAGHHKSDRQPSGDLDHKTFKAAERQGIDARDLSALVVDAWTGAAGDRLEFVTRMKRAGYALAAGDRRGFVLVDHARNTIGLRGLLKPLGLKAKEIRAVLGEPEQAQSVEQASAGLQPPTLTAAFAEHTDDPKPPAITKLEKAIAAKKETLEKIKERQSRTMAAFEDAARARLKDAAEQAQESGDTSSSSGGGGGMAAPVVVEIEREREELRQHHQEQRSLWVNQIKQLRQDLRASNLRDRAERVLRYMRQRAAPIYDAWNKVKAELLKPPAKQPTPTPQPSQEHIGPLKSTRDLIRDRLADVEPEQDKGRDRDRPRPPPKRPSI